MNYPHNSVMRWNAISNSWHVPEIKYDISFFGQPNFIIAVTGQSNSQGAGGSYDEKISDDQVHKRIHGFNNSTNRWEIADLRTDSLGLQGLDENNEWNRSFNSQSFAFHFAKQMVNKYPDIVVGIINVGIGEQSISRWVLDINGDIYKKHVKVITKSLEHLNISKKIDVICWHQGESDANMSLKIYKNNLYQVINQYRNELFCNKNTPFIVGQTIQNGNQSLELQNNNLLNLNIDDDNFTSCINTGDLESNTDNQNDKVHFSSESHRQLGKRYYNAYKIMTIGDINENIYKQKFKVSFDNFPHENYIKTYPDLMDWNPSKETAYLHWLEHGLNEDRILIFCTLDATKINFNLLFNTYFSYLEEKYRTGYFGLYLVIKYNIDLFDFNNNSLQPNCLKHNHYF